jgi:DNA-binding transcriptional ArsR family regulator
MTPAHEIELSLEELLAMRADLVADQESIQASLAWVDSEIAALPPEAPPVTEAAASGGKRSYVRVSPAKIRTFIQRNGDTSKADLASHFGISEGSVYNHTKALFEAGTLVKVRISGRVYFRIAKPGVPASAPKPRPTHKPKLRLVSGVPGTGKANIKVRRRKGSITGTHGQKGR